MRLDNFKITVEDFYKIYQEDSKKMTLGGVEVPTDIPNLLLYKLKGYKCVACSIKGEIFYIEKYGEGSEYYNNWHLNLYAFKNGHKILMTKDHIVPKIAGGNDNIINLQTMCKCCNNKKGSKSMQVFMQGVEVRKLQDLNKEEKIKISKPSFRLKTIKRMQERYGLSIEDQHYKELNKLSSKSKILCNLSGKKSIRELKFKNKNINLIYNQELGLVETVIDSDYNKIMFDYLPNHIPKDFAEKVYVEIFNIIEKEYKTFESDKDTALYFKTCQYPKAMFVKWKKVFDIRAIVWREVIENFNKIYKNTENNQNKCVHLQYETK